MPASMDFLTDILSRFLRGESVDHYLAPDFVGLGGLLGSRSGPWRSVDEVSARLIGKGARYDITVTEQIELGDGRVFLAGAARRSRPGGRGFATPFGAVVTMRDGLIRSIQTSSHAQALRRVGWPWGADFARLELSRANPALVVFTGHTQSSAGHQAGGAHARSGVRHSAGRSVGAAGRSS